MWTSELSTLSSHKGPLLYQVSEAILAAARLSFFRALASCFSPLEAKVIAETALTARGARAACPPSVRLRSSTVCCRAVPCAPLRSPSGSRLGLPPLLRIRATLGWGSTGCSSSDLALEVAASAIWTSELSTLSSHKGPLLYQVSEAILAAARLSFFRALASCFRRSRPRS